MKVARHLHAADHSRRIDHSLAVVGQDRAVTVAKAVRMTWARGDQVSDVLEYSLHQTDNIRSDIVDKRLGEHVFEDTMFQACKILVCNLDTLSVVPWDAHRDTRLRQNNTHIWHTTSILAFVASCIREEIRRRRTFCKDLLTNVCRRWLSVHVHEDDWAVALVVESFVEKGLYGEVGTAEDREDSQQV